MSIKLSQAEIKALGFDWEDSATLAAYQVMAEGNIDLEQTVANMKQSRSYQQGQVNAAYRFKQQTGADYADFTDKRDDHARQLWQVRQAIQYVERIIAAAQSAEMD